jgi:hypothetical protein
LSTFTALLMLAWRKLRVSGPGGTFPLLRHVGHIATNRDARRGGAAATVALVTVTVLLPAIAVPVTPVHVSCGWLEPPQSRRPAGSGVDEVTVCAGVGRHWSAYESQGGHSAGVDRSRG